MISLVNISFTIMRLFFQDCRGEAHFVLTIFFKRITKDQKQIWEGVLINIHKKNDDLSNVELN